DAVAAAWERGWLRDGRALPVLAEALAGKDPAVALAGAQAIEMNSRIRISPPSRFASRYRTRFMPQVYSPRPWTALGPLARRRWGWASLWCLLFLYHLWPLQGGQDLPANARRVLLGLARAKLEEAGRGVRASLPAEPPENPKQDDPSSPAT